MGNFYSRLTQLDPAAASGHYDAAMANFEKALSIYPRPVDVFTNVILIQGSNKEYPPALIRCDQQLKQYAGFPALTARVYNIKGVLYLARGEKAAAIKSFQTAIRENPDYLKPYYALAGIYLQEYQEKKAIDQYKDLPEVNPNQAQPHVILGIIYDTQKRYDKSEAHYLAALEFSPDFAAAVNYLAFILANKTKISMKHCTLPALPKKNCPTVLTVWSPSAGYIKKEDSTARPSVSFRIALPRFLKIRRGFII
jgi:tetratricopeptide (TPR) repeat protein